MHAPRFALVAILTAFVSMIGAQSALALPIVNGSLTGPIDNGASTGIGVPPGWLAVVGSPDTMDENNNVGVSGLLSFAATPSPSPDGGTWVGVATNAGGGDESFGQSIGGLAIGTVYSVSWYQANFGHSGRENPDVIEVLVDGVVVGNGSLAPLAPGWTCETVQFTATAVSHLPSFRPAGGHTLGGSYLSIDGISVSGLPGFCGLCPDTVIQSGEQCDDGNTTPGDGCSATCQDEVCGNLFVDPGEECDDGNTTAGDGCSDVCLTEDPVLVPGFGVVGMLSLAMLLVGVGTVLVIRSRDGAAV